MPTIMRIEELMKLQQQQQQTITKMEATDSDEQQQQHLNIMDGNETEDEEDLPAQFNRVILVLVFFANFTILQNIFLPPLGSPASPPVVQLPSTNSHPPQPIPLLPPICPTSTSQMAAVQALWLQQAAAAAAAALTPVMQSASVASGFSSAGSLQSAAPTAENFLHFMQLAHTFGFQLDFGHKVQSGASEFHCSIQLNLLQMLHFTPGTIPSPHSPVCIGATVPIAPVATAVQQQQSEQGQQKGKRKGKGQGRHLLEVDLFKFGNKGITGFIAFLPCEQIFVKIGKLKVNK